MKRLLSISVLTVLLSCQEKPAAPHSSGFPNFIENFNASNEAVDILDLSTAHFNAELEQVREQLKVLSAIDSNQLSFEDRIDWRFAFSI